MTNIETKIVLTLSAMLLGGIFGNVALAQSSDDSKPKDPSTLASEEAERMARQLDLDDSQLFYIDSILCHDYVAMCTELDKLSKAKVENFDLFYTVQDKWMEKIDNAVKKVLTPQQQAKFMKQGGQKRANDRAKRREMAEKAALNEKINKKKKK